MDKEPYILYIEDERAMIDLVNQTFQFLGYKINSAMSGRQGLTMIREQKPDLLLLDLMMPDLNGWDVYRTLKTDHALTDIPVIVVTARPPRAGRIILEGLPPADAYITKPFDVEELIDSVQNLL